VKTESVKSINPFKSVIQTSYDIVKAHGGELKVETKEEEGLPAGQTGSLFTIQLPITA
jgi:signal transduction histidine kinase